ncbi:MAG: ribonuclease P protein subunit [Nanoarchaeota archaeon]
MKLLSKEFIGEIAEVIEAKNKSLVGIKGKIVDETRNLFVIDTSKGERKILKNQVTLKVKHKGKVYAIDGKLLVGRGYERLKK